MLYTWNMMRNSGFTDSWSLTPLLLPTKPLVIKGYLEYGLARPVVAPWHVEHTSVGPRCTDTRWYRGIERGRPGVCRNSDLPSLIMMLNGRSDNALRLVSYLRWPGIVSLSSSCAWIEISWPLDCRGKRSGAKSLSGQRWRSVMFGHDTWEHDLNLDNGVRRVDQLLEKCGLGKLFLTQFDLPYMSFRFEMFADIICPSHLYVRRTGSAPSMVCPELRWSDHTVKHPSPVCLVNTSILLSLLRRWWKFFETIYYDMVNIVQTSNNMVAHVLNLSSIVRCWY